MIPTQEETDFTKAVKNGISKQVDVLSLTGDFFPLVRKKIAFLFQKSSTYFTSPGKMAWGIQPLYFTVSISSTENCLPSKAFKQWLEKSKLWNLLGTRSCYTSSTLWHRICSSQWQKMYLQDLKNKDFHLALSDNHPPYLMDHIFLSWGKYCQIWCPHGAREALAGGSLQYRFYSL